MSDTQPPATDVPDLEGHPLETETETQPALHPTHALVLEAHAVLKRGIEAFDRRGIGHQPNIDDVRLAFRALDAVLGEVGTGS